MDNGFNRSPLNRSMLGSGVASPYRRAASAIVCAVVGTCRAVMTKYVSAQQSVSAVGHIVMEQRSALAIYGLISVVGSMVPRVLIHKYEVIREYLRANYSANASAIYSGKAAQSQTVAGSMAIHVYHQIYASASQVCGINGAASGITFSGSPTSERRVVIPASERVMHIGVRNDTSGV